MFIGYYTHICVVIRSFFSFLILMNHDIQLLVNKPPKNCDATVVGWYWATGLWSKSGELESRGEEKKCGVLTNGNATPQAQSYILYRFFKNIKMQGHPRV